MRPARSIRGASRSRSPGFRAGTTRRAIEGLRSVSQGGGGSVSAPASIRDTSPGTSLRRVRARTTKPARTVLRDDATLASGDAPGAGASCFVLVSSAVRVADSGGRCGERRSKSSPTVPFGSSSAHRFIRGIARDWFSGAGGVTCRRECIGSSRVPRSGSHHTTSTIRLGGTIPSAPLVSTGKPLATRCHSRVSRTRAIPTGSGELAPRECARQGLQPGALRGKSKWALRRAIRCDCASSVFREGAVKEQRRKNAE
jgi:hypothetical protein